MIEEIRTQLAENLKNLDGVVALRQTDQGAAPYLFQNGDNLEQLVLEPRYPVSETTSKLQKRFKDANIGIVREVFPALGSHAQILPIVSADSEQLPSLVRDCIVSISVRVTLSRALDRIDCAFDRACHPHAALST